MTESRDNVGTPTHPGAFFHGNWRQISKERWDKRRINCLNGIFGGPPDDCDHFHREGCICKGACGCHWVSWMDHCFGRNKE